MDSFPIWLAVVVGTGAALYVLHRAALFLEANGWLYYINRRPKVSMIATLAATFDPTLRRMLEAKQREYNLEEDESGDSPGARGGRHALLRNPNGDR